MLVITMPEADDVKSFEIRNNKININPSSSNSKSSSSSSSKAQFSCFLINSSTAGNSASHKKTYNFYFYTITGKYGPILIILSLCIPSWTTIHKAEVKLTISP